MNAPSPPDADRFRRAYDATYLDVLRFVQRRVPPDRAEDVVAAMLAAWRRAEDLPADLDGQRAWLFGIAHNCLLDDRRSARREDALAVRLAVTAPRAITPRRGRVRRPPRRPRPRLGLPHPR